MSLVVDCGLVTVVMASFGHDMGGCQKVIRLDRSCITLPRAASSLAVIKNA